MKSHGGYLACQHCEGSGTKMIDPVTHNKTGPVIWPSTTLNQRPRNSEEIRQWTSDPDFPNWSDQRKMGIKGRSLLADFKNNRIDLVLDVQVDYMHNMCLGMGKDLLQQLLCTTQGSKKRTPYFNYISGKQLNQK